MVPLRLGHQNIEPRTKKGMRENGLVIVRPQFLTGGDTKGLCPPSISNQGMEGQGFWFFHVVKELNNGFFILSKS